MSVILEILLNIVVDVALEVGGWRLFVGFMLGCSFAGVVWWKMPEGAVANLIAVGSILLLSGLGAMWERRA